MLTQQCPLDVEVSTNSFAKFYNIKHELKSRNFFKELTITEIPSQELEQLLALDLAANVVFNVDLLVGDFLE